MKPEDQKKREEEKKAFKTELHSLTKSLFSTDDGARWLQMMKEHFRYYNSEADDAHGDHVRLAVLSAKKEPFKLIDCYLNYKIEK